MPKPSSGNYAQRAGCQRFNRHNLGLQRRKKTGVFELKVNGTYNCSATKLFLQKHNLQAEEDKEKCWLIIY
jgi:hypothetical protein